jgi:alkaline phosphatase D
MMIKRRSLLAAAASAPVAAPRVAWANQLATGIFTHGVASGDPLPDGIVLWTRFVGGDGRIAWEVAEDETFARVARRGEVTAAFINDFCAKVDVRGLEPGRQYFFRFLSGSGPSLTGRTRTAPRGGVSQLSIALFSCANFPFGYFHAYGHAAQREDIDLAVHVGDYIYEYPRGNYPSAADTVPGRFIEPFGETITLNDYYQRYATYHTDPYLLELRRLKPMSAVWDDHEITNDAWRAGAQNHQADVEGTYVDRIASAAKAYFDWMPIRPPERAGPRLYRSLDWGDLARILLLDTRYIGRDRQLDYRGRFQERVLAGEDPAALAAEFRPLLDDPNRGILGATQEAWLNNAMATSKAAGQRWQIIAQQVQIAEQRAPSNLTSLIGAEIGAGGRAWFETAQRLTPLGLPWNLDTWNGYPAARARLLESCIAHANNAVILAGDSHNCWVNTVRVDERVAALEFAGGSVSSPGMERTLTGATPEQRAETLRSANPDMAFCDIGKRGYGALTFTREACEAEWIAFDDIRPPTGATASVTRLVSAASAGSGPGAWNV